MWFDERSVERCREDAPDRRADEAVKTANMRFPLRTSNAAGDDSRFVRESILAPASCSGVPSVRYTPYVAGCMHAVGFTSDANFIGVCTGMSMAMPLEWAINKYGLIQFFQCQGDRNSKAGETKFLCPVTLCRLIQKES
jgi:hypothetical protein